MIGFAVVAGLPAAGLTTLDCIVAGFNVLLVGVLFDFWLFGDVKDACLVSITFGGTISFNTGLSFGGTAATLPEAAGFLKLLILSAGTLFTGATRAIGALLGDGRL